MALRSETASEFWPYNQRQDPLKKSCVRMCGWRGRWLAEDCTQWCFESKVKMGRPPAAAATSTLDTSSTLSISDFQVFLLLILTLHLPFLLYLLLLLFPSNFIHCCNTSWQGGINVYQPAMRKPCWLLWSHSSNNCLLQNLKKICFFNLTCAGLSTTVLPAAKSGEIFHASIISG